MKLSQRLNALVENPHLKGNKRDYGFAISLLEAYQRQGRLTPGRRPWLDKLEIKYSEAEVAKRASDVDQILLHRLERLRVPESLHVSLISSPRLKGSLLTKLSQSVKLSQLVTMTNQQGLKKRLLSPANITTPRTTS